MNCGDCKYSHDMGTVLLCWGQRFAPPVDRDDWCEGWKPKSATNYDRLISKTPEELAETYAGGCPNGDRLNCGKYYLHGGRDCFNCWLDWLKSPVEEVDDG
jgi:hypothetical protein